MAALLWLAALVGLLDCTQSASAVDWSSAPAIPLASGQLRLQQATVHVVRLSGFCTYRVALKASDTPFHAAWGVSTEWELLTRAANSTRCEVGPVHTSEHSVQHSSHETALFLIGPPHEADHGILDVRLQGGRPSAQSSVVCVPAAVMLPVTSRLQGSAARGPLQARPAAAQTAALSSPPWPRQQRSSFSWTAQPASTLCTTQGTPWAP